MRLFLALVLVAGCIGEPGLDSSTRDCPASEPVADGFLVHINGSAPFQGYCLALADRNEDIDRDVALRRVDGDAVMLPVDGPSEYYIHMSVAFGHDRFCADHIGAFHHHSGQGVMDVTVENTPVCA